MESGSYGYFYHVDDRAPTDEADIPAEYKEDSYYAYCWGDGEVVYVEKEDYYENDEDWRECEKLVMNEAAIKRGLDLFAKHCKRHFKDFVTENDDVITANEFMQCCLYPDYVEEKGHTVYG